MPYRVINIYYSVMCYNDHINSTRIQSIASMALMVFPDVGKTYVIVVNVELTVADSEHTVVLPIYGKRPPFGCTYGQMAVFFQIRQFKH